MSSDKALDLTVGRDEPASAWALGQRGRVLWADQFHEEARQSFLQAHAVAVRHGDAANAALIAGHVGMCLLELGQLPEARTWVARAVDEAARAGAPAVEARWLVGLARVALAQGVLDEADALAERALAVSRPLGHHLTTFRAEWLRHYLAALSDPGQRDRGPVHGFSAETAAATVIFAASGFGGSPISTTHTIATSILGVGASKRLSAVRWGIAGNMVTAWILTIPASAAVAAGCFLLLDLFGMAG